MSPANPPLPAPQSRPFQSAAGNQTSKLMSESLDGLATPATRQNAFRSGSASPSGVLKAPASTRVALPMVVCRSLRLARFLHSDPGEAAKMDRAGTNSAIAMSRRGMLIGRRLEEVNAMLQH